MPFRLIVTRGAGAAAPSEYFFDQGPIAIGRDSRADLRLPDEQRVISKLHAEIREQDGGLAVVDLGSKNYTYLNDRRLDAEHPVPIHHGDQIRIGEFEILFEIAAPVADVDDDRTVFDPQFVNPFVDDAHQLAVLLQRMRVNFDRQPARRREDALQEALQEALPEEDPHQVYDAVFHRLGCGESGDRPQYIGSPAQRMSLDTSVSMPARDDLRQRSPAADVAADGHLLDILLGSVSRLMNIPWQFRHEFAGQTIVQSAANAPIFSGDAAAIRRFLSSAASGDEEEERLGMLAQAAEEVVLHQLAMLDGYRATVMQGAQDLLESFDPDAELAAVVKENAVYRLIPFMAAGEALKRLRARWTELRSEDWATAERRSFRPAFIKAYLARMTSGRR